MTRASRALSLLALTNSLVMTPLATFKPSQEERVRLNLESGAMGLLDPLSRRHGQELSHLLVPMAFLKGV